MKIKTQNTSEKRQNTESFLSYNTQYLRLELCELLESIYYKADSNGLLWYHYNTIKDDFYSVIKDLKK